MDDAKDNSDGLPAPQGNRCRASDPHLPCIADREIVEDNPQWWEPGMKARWGATHASAVEGVGAAISARTAAE